MNNEQVEIDSRPSDAIALAVRAEAPIFVEDEVIDQAGVLLDDEGLVATDDEGRPEPVKPEELEKMSAFRDFIGVVGYGRFRSRSQASPFRGRRPVGRRRGCGAPSSPYRVAFSPPSVAPRHLPLKGGDLREGNGSNRGYRVGGLVVARGVCDNLRIAPVGGVPMRQWPPAMQLMGIGWYVATCIVPGQLSVGSCWTASWARASRSRSSDLLWVWLRPGWGRGTGCCRSCSRRKPRQRRAEQDERDEEERG